MTDVVPFTCLLPVWKGDDAEAFAEAVRSIAGSTLAPTEVLICQDGDLPEVLDRAVADAVTLLRARRVRNPGRTGLHHNLNHALASVRTPWIARCDADDINAPKRFEIQARTLAARPEVGVLGCGLIEFWPDGRTRAKAMPLTHEAIVAWARWRSPINHNAVFYRTADVLDCGGYPDVPLKEDYALWLALIARGVRFANLEDALVRARLGEGFYTRRAGSDLYHGELQLYRLKQDIAGLRGPLSAIAFAARCAALASGPAARVAYQLGLRQ